MTADRLRKAAEQFVLRNVAWWESVDDTIFLDPEKREHGTQLRCKYCRGPVWFNAGVVQHAPTCSWQELQSAVQQYDWVEAG